jgi:hypothetical protein
MPATLSFNSLSALQAVINCGFGVTATVVMTVMAAVAVSVQPAEIAVTVYVVLVEGLANTELPTVVLMPVAGAHVNRSKFPSAFSSVKVPAQIVVAVGVTLNAGAGTIVSVVVAVALQPLVVPVTV